MFTYDELVYIEEDPALYRVTAYVQVNVGSDEFYEKLYIKA